MKVFLDTGALIAIFVEGDEWHGKCVEKYKTYKKEGSLFFTSIFVLSELYTRILHDYGKEALKKVIATVSDLQQDGKLRVFQVESGIFSDSEETMIKFAEHKLSFTDSSNLVFIKNFKLDEIFTLDSGFKKVGLKSSF